MHLCPDFLLGAYFWIMPSDFISGSTYIQGEPITGLFLTVDNFAAVSGRKTFDVSKVSKFYLEKVNQI